MMNPLYPVFLSAVWHIFGESRIAVGVIQSLLDTGTAFLIFLMGRRLFGRPTGRLDEAITAFQKTCTITSLSAIT